MKRLIVCRHGDFDANRRLSFAGKEQIRALAWVLRSYLARDAACVKLLTSTAPRAVDSARLLIQTHDIPDTNVIHSDKLWCGDGLRNQDDVTALLQVAHAADGADVLVVVTHHEYCASLPSMYAHRLGLPNVPPRLQIHRGQARVLDCTTGECVTVGRCGFW